MQKLAIKLLAVQRGITPIEKDGHNDFQNYDYATEGGYIQMLRPLLIENGLVILSSVKSSSIAFVKKDKDGKETPITRVEMDFTIVDAESGEQYVGGAEGYGADSLDKGIYKAITGATKYFMAKCFQIPTGDDPENEHVVNEGRPVPTRKPIVTKPMDIKRAAVKEIKSKEPFPNNTPAGYGPCAAEGCNGLMKVGSNAKGKLLVCSNYPACKSMKPL